MSIFDSLSPEERRKLLKAIGKAEEMPSQLSAIQIKDIEPVESWLEKEYYVGRDGLRIYDYYKDFFPIIFDKDKPINEVIFDGGLGTGKTTVGDFLLVRKLYELSCFKNVTAKFDLMTSTLLCIVYLSVSQTTAALTGFAQLRNIIDSIPYFKKEFPRDETIMSLLRFPENLLMMSGSDEGSFIGTAMIGCILDEANFFKGQGSSEAAPNFSKVQSMYSTARNRASSRFAKHGRDDSLQILISSPRSSASFVEERKRLAADDPSSLVIHARLWDVNPKAYSQEKFYVFLGNEQMDPMIIDTMADLNSVIALYGLPPFGELDGIIPAINSLPAHVRSVLTDVPSNFYKNYKQNLIKALQDMSGIAVAPIGKLFTARTVYNLALRDGPQPFTKETIELSTATTTTVMDYLNKEFEWKNKEKPRFIHVDQSVQTDKTGLAVAYIDKWVMDEGQLKPEIVVECMLSVRPPQRPAQLPIGKVRDFIFYLRDKVGLNIALVTYDTYQSFESIQVLREAGFEARTLSVDRSDEQYLTLTNLYFEGRISHYRHTLYEKELFGLNWYRAKGRVDHDPANGTDGPSKDLSDGVCGAVWNALNYEERGNDSGGDISSMTRGNSVYDDEDDAAFSLEELGYNRR